MMTEKLINSENVDLDEPQKESVGRSCVKLVTYRLMIRAVMIGIICLLMYFLPIVDFTLEYCDYISGFPLSKQVFFFILGATTFHTVMPTGYLPTVLSGLVFSDHFLIGWAVSYTSVNLGSMLNMLWVRAVDSGYVKRFLKKKLSAFAFLNKMLVLKPFQTILLFRLPYLYVGTVNYIMAFSDVDFRIYLLGNAIGYISGSGLFTGLGRSSRNILEMISKTHSLSRTEIYIEMAIFLTIIMCSILAIIVAKSVIKQEKDSGTCKHSFMEFEVKQYGERKCSICSMNECRNCEFTENEEKRLTPSTNDPDHYVLLQ